MNGIDAGPKPTYEGKIRVPPPPWDSHQTDAEAIWVVSLSLIASVDFFRLRQPWQTVWHSEGVPEFFSKKIDFENSADDNKSIEY